MIASTQVTWDDVQLFLSLVRTRRLAATGQALGCDTSTASRRLAKLESELDLSLFDRTREGLVPTATALRLLGPAEEMERASHGFRRELDGLEREVEGVVRLSVPPGVAESFVAPMLGPLAARHPRLRFEVDASVRQADLTRREADLALRTIRPTGGPLVRQLLTRAQWVPMATPERVAALGPLQRWSDVPWVGWGAGLEQLHAARWLAERVKAPPVLRTNSFVMQVSVVQQGLGVALVPAPYAAVHRLEPLRLSRKLAADARSLPVDDLWLVTHEALRRVPRVAAVWDFIAAAMSV
ncbi:MAG: LysR family transcriptional regulator [Archangium sp.]|nr:LysR family transcriptional regulator [Archangium sp.]